MATMIPDLSPNMIENDGERLFYAACRELPPLYTVLYSYRYRTRQPGQTVSGQDLREADFVVVHPEMGYIVFEVKQGNIMYANGEWCEFTQRHGRLQAHPMDKDPVVQAETAMWAILKRYQEKTGSSRFPLNIKYGLCFPETKRMSGELPDFLDPQCVFLHDDLYRLDQRIKEVFNYGKTPADTPTERLAATKTLVDKVLAPSFKAFALLEEQIQMFSAQAHRVLTEEQTRILEETELDKKKVFFGAAGTGKTYLAMEKARTLAAEGNRVFLTCYNKHLARTFKTSLPPEVTCSNFHDYLLNILERGGYPVGVPKSTEEQESFFQETLPEKGFDHFAQAPPEQKFDSIIVDEGQDFHENWLICLESMLKDRENGEFYIFADPNQDLFGVMPDHLMNLPVSKHRLTRNLRNVETVSNWLLPFVPQGHLHPVLRGGIPVTYHSWETPSEERALLTREIGRLVSQGVKPNRILILSPNRLKNSCLSGCNKIGAWPLADFSDRKANRPVPSTSITFATIRSFKGLESDIVFLIGLQEGKLTCTDADIYVGASRARFMLQVFHHKSDPPKALGITGHMM